ncbi:MAG TPA: tripartite tricarboxylate transporter substrate binding protein [Burkholderiales bacterium]|nr:tripartite tricarboxylate transporter substrate binding protein [Burkholderiales bacterium]
MSSRLFSISLLAAISASSAQALAAQATNYPERAIRLIVPFSPGGTTDFSARIVADALTEELGQQLVVDNRGGAGSAVGTLLATQATPDGYTILLANIGLAVNETLRPKRGYRALDALTPISVVGLAPSALVVNKDTRFKTVADLVKAAKAQPGKIVFGSAGVGSSTHLSMSYLQSVAGMKLHHVPYKGGGPAVAGMIGGEVQAVLTPIPTAFPHIKSGRVRVLAVSSGKRSSVLPDVPTIAESGVPGFEFSTWFGLLAPAGTPKARIERLNQATVQVLRSPDLIKKLRAAGMEPAPTTPEEFGALIRSDIPKWRKVIKEAGIPTV